MKRAQGSAWMGWAVFAGAPGTVLATLVALPLGIAVGVAAFLAYRHGSILESSRQSELSLDRDRERRAEQTASLQRDRERWLDETAALNAKLDARELSEEEFDAQYEELTARFPD